MRKIFCFLILVFVFSAYNVLAESFLVVVLDSYEQPSKIEDIAVLALNDFTDPRLYEDHSEDSSSIMLVLEDSLGNEISRKILEGPGTSAFFDNRTAKVKIVSGQRLLLEQSISFCNNNGICEPCKGANCRLIENSLTCNDCYEGVKDFFCSGMINGSCDPDCLDFDNGCELFVCEHAGGIVCSENEMCTGIASSFLANAGSCCKSGVCVSINEYVETSVELQNRPDATISHSGKQASDFDGEPALYCTDSLRGMLCAPEESCNGEEVEYYYGFYCCLGECKEDYGAAMVYPEEVMPVIRKNLSEEEQAEIDTSGWTVSSIDGGGEFVADINLWRLPIISEENLTVDSVKAPAVVFNRAILPENVSSEYRHIEDSFIDRMKNSNVTYVSIAIVAVLLFLFLLISLFRKSASKKFRQDEKIMPDLQKEIDSLALQGKDYKMIEQILLQKGFDKVLVDLEIRKNYHRRLESSLVKK